MSPFSTASDGSSLVVRTLPTARCPVASSMRTRSVNVPPMSMPTRYRFSVCNRKLLRDYRQPVRQPVEAFDAAGEHVYEVFDHDGTSVGGVCGRLNSQHHAWLYYRPVALRDVGRFLVEGVDPQRVPVMTAAEARVAVLGDVVLGDTEDLIHLDARSYLRARPVMRLLKYTEKPSGCRLHPTVGERTSTIPTVAADGRTAVELDEVAILQTGVSLGVDADPHSCADGGQDPLVRVVLVAGIFHRSTRDAHYVSVAHVRCAHAWREVLDREAHPRLRELRCPPEPLDLEGVLYTSELVHIACEVHPLGLRGKGREASVRVEEHVAQVRPDPGAEQTPVPEQPAYDLILLTLVELRGPWHLRFPAPERFLYRLGVTDLRPQPVGPDVLDTRYSLRRFCLEVPDHHPYFD